MALWIRADMRASLGQAITVALVVAGVVAALLLSAGLLQGATNPWQGLFTATRGAQIWLLLAPGTQVVTLRREVPGIDAIAGPSPATAATLMQPGQRTRVELRAMAPRLPSIGRPLVVSGHWLSSAATDGVVLEVTFAQAVHASVGERLVLRNVDGSIAARVRVAGLAPTSDHAFSPAQPPHPI